MRTTTTRLQSISGVSPLLLLLLGCGDSPTSFGDNVAPQASFSSQASDSRGSKVGAEYRADAEFYANPPLACKETEARLSATEKDGAATVDFTYSVLGTCGGAEGLYYYVLSSEGPVSIDPSDLFIHPGLRRASLDTEIRVYDDEAGQYGTIRIQASWERTAREVFVARLEVSGGFLSQQYLTNPLYPSVSAELTRSRSAKQPRR